MKIEIIPGENNVKFKQTSKGTWVCEGLCIYCQSIFDGITTAEKAILEVEKMLQKINKGQ